MKTFNKKYIEIDGYAGSLGAAFLYDKDPKKVDKLFREDYVREGRVALDEGRDLPLIEDGILAQLARICKEEKCGYELELRKVPVKQFAIEVCEIFREDPYLLPCNAIIRLTDKETPASCGCTTQALAKILLR